MQGYEIKNKKSEFPYIKYAKIELELKIHFSFNKTKININFVIRKSML